MPVTDDHPSGSLFPTLHLASTETKSGHARRWANKAACECSPIPDPDDDVEGWDHEVPPAEPIELEWRHGWWQRDRYRVYVALRASGASGRVLWRFANCGGDSVVEWHRTLKRHRVRCFTCRNRWCRACAKTRARHVVEKMLKLTEGKVCSFTLLTLRADSRTLKQRQDFLLRCLARLRDRKWWRERVPGGAVFLETTRGQDGRHWHIHAHLIHEGEPLALPYLSDVWSKITGGSFKVGSQRVAGAAGVVGYVTDYVTKGLDETVLANVDLLAECIASFRGRRLFIPFGSWWGVDFERERDDKDGWSTVERLPVVVAQARAGQVWAIACLRSLNRGFDEAGRIIRVVVDQQTPTTGRTARPPPDD